MNVLVALLRAVNVGGTGKLSMTDLRALCAQIGFADIRTYIQSGNVVFRAGMEAEAAKAALEERLRAHFGAPVGVVMRDAQALRDLLARNPYPQAAPNRLGILFLDDAPAPDAADQARGRADEEIALGQREIFIHYPSGMGRSRLRLPAMEAGTIRNLNTAAKLAEMAAA